MMRAPAAGSSAAFYGDVPAFARFERIADPALYRPLPPDWSLGLADVVQSTAAIAAGRYKAVNMAGAAVIAAVVNALKSRDFPFVFGGDGASFAVSGRDAGLAAAALAATATFVREELGLDLRIAMVSVSRVRESGLDVRVARFAPNPDVAYAMFSGGGLAWAETEMKRGAFAMPPAAAGSRPNLAGLSCRFAPVASARGVVLSVIVAPGPEQDPAGFRQLVEAILVLAEAGREAGRPLPDVGPMLHWPPGGLDLEARATRRRLVPRILHRLWLLVFTLFAFGVMRTGIKLGRFDPARYRRELVANSDFRKFDDGLRLTVDCTPERADRIAARLEAAARAGIARYGLHRQDAALITCFVPSPVEPDHLHFIDGAGGGYAMAARMLKGRP